MGCAHHKRHVPAGLTDPRDDEERRGSKISADAPPRPRACDTADKYAGDRRTERL